ncbi:hypothetical protein MCBB_2178 [Methanobacterium congolense]|uniref:Uncharacterized protein n=1 Tax=Methanobacterium congolense TaxID=118062 RepID=A0A1D3L5G2_9EURY|nr:hypothetical protein MCBB_2178 [Methanobacterium congolense]
MLFLWEYIKKFLIVLNPFIVVYKLKLELNLIKIKFEGQWHAENNPHSVPAAFIFASYLCLIQDSLTVFALASRGMAVSPFLLVSSACASYSFTRRRVVSAPVSCLLACAL